MPVDVNPDDDSYACGFESDLCASSQAATLQHAIEFPSHDRRRTPAFPFQPSARPAPPTPSAESTRSARMEPAGHWRAWGRTAAAINAVIATSNASATPVARPTPVGRCRWHGAEAVVPRAPNSLTDRVKLRSCKLWGSTPPNEGISLVLLHSTVFTADRGDSRGRIGRGDLRGAGPRRGRRARLWLAVDRRDVAGLRRRARGRTERVVVPCARPRQMEDGRPDDGGRQSSPASNFSKSARSW